MLGKGGFGITYVAYDWVLHRHMAIKELLPDTIATRIEGNTVVAMGPSHQENWLWARERFVEEARILAGFRHPNIIAVHRLIEANGTVYLVMDHLEGESYEARLQRIKREPDQESLMAIITPILHGLQEVHAAGLLHRDIKPENILFDKRGNPVLIDFGAARASVGATMAMTSIVTHGYSPIEQYQTKGKMGPWTDIYAVAAVMCRAITGEKPSVAADRLMEDDFHWLSDRQVDGFTQQFLKAVDWALHVKPDDRPATIAAWAIYLTDSYAKQEAAFTADIQLPYIQRNQTAEAEEASEPSPKSATRKSPFVNSLQMRFVPIRGTDVLFSIWDTRVRDFKTFVEISGYAQKPLFKIFKFLQPQWDDPGFEQTADHPVVNVSWEDAKAFCQWMTEKDRNKRVIATFQKYRLPTDAEWSAAVGLPPESGCTPEEKDENVRDVYPWGGDWPPSPGAGNYAPLLGVDFFENTSPVGIFQPNYFGLYDMGGNVWEWCEDWYSAEEKNRVIRGAAWCDSRPQVLLSSFRNYDCPEVRDSSNGFRCVLTTQK